MRIAPCFAKQTIAILGLGRTGVHAALALQAGGAKVLAWDDVEQARNNAIKNKVPVVSLNMVDWNQVVALILSPGIPHNYPAPHPIVAKAIKAEVPVLSDIDVLGRCYPLARYIGITGTNGKTTTTSLIGHILKHAGISAHVAGNIGTSVFALDVTESESSFVLEMSSYQLELTHSIRFDTAVLLDITPDHLTRHGGLKGYIAAKQRIFAGQTQQDLAVIGVDTPLSCKLYQQICDKGGHQVIPISGERVLLGGVYVHQGILVDDIHGAQQQITDLTEIASLKGLHNGQNAAAAYVVARRMGVLPAEIVKAFQTFVSLPHRQEVVATHNRVQYINDSKATNVDATKQALAHFENIHWILGGQFKEESLEALYPFLKRVDHAYLIGEATEKFSKWLEGKVALTKAVTLERAVDLASHQAQNKALKKAVVLLSPACASFDQFKDFEARGEAFRTCVLGQLSLARTGSD